jgi:hypothetical protein
MGAKLALQGNRLTPQAKWFCFVLQGKLVMVHWCYMHFAHNLPVHGFACWLLIKAFLHRLEVTLCCIRLRARLQIASCVRVTTNSHLERPKRIKDWFSLAPSFEPGLYCLYIHTSGQRGRALALELADSPNDVHAHVRTARACMRTVLNMIKKALLRN